VLSDEIYEQLVYGDARATCFATLRPGLAERTLTVSGASKTYAMTGWRMGWTLGPAHVIKAIGNVQSQQIGCPSSVGQYAALAARVSSLVHDLQTERDIAVSTPAAATSAASVDAAREPAATRFVPSSAPASPASAADATSAARQAKRVRNISDLHSCRRRGAARPQPVPECRART
jgi:aspartate/methionine/tyrosine aminotransferase